MDIVDFVAYLSLGGLAPATIATYISGIKHHLRVRGANDFSDGFLLQITLKGVAAQPHQQDIRLQITLPVLVRMLQALPVVHQNAYEVCLYSAILTLGFHSPFRPGELGWARVRSGHGNGGSWVRQGDQSPSHFSPHAIAVHNVHIRSNRASIILPSSKSNHSSMPQQIIVHTSNIACPISNLTAYVKSCPPKPGQLFIKLLGHQFSYRTLQPY